MSVLRTLAALLLAAVSVGSVCGEESAGLPLGREWAVVNGEIEEGTVDGTAILRWKPTAGQRASLALPPSQWEMWGDETDRAIILAHLGNEELRCPGCGGYLDETTDRSLVNRVHEDLVCHRCAAMATHRAHREERHAPLLPGTLLWAESIRPDPPTDN